MRLQILSDLHVEFATFTLPHADADVVVLAGDVHLGRKVREWIREQIRDKPVIYVLGNHEFYRQAIPELTETLQRETDGSHIHVLENTTVRIEGVTFLGCTLWTDFALFGDPVEAGREAARVMSDYQLIRVSPEYRRLTGKDTARMHAHSRRWLEDQLKKCDPSSTVVVTHHAPSPRSLRPAYADSLLSAAFASALDEVIEASGVPLWVHGHTHHQADYTVGTTRVLSNQRGYPDAPVAGFDPGLVIEFQ